jgi:RNA polymerase subunit RPABC4/transcription elongation factor Spt4
MAKLWQEVGSRTAGVTRPVGAEGMVPPEAASYGEYGDRYSQQACDKVVGILRKVREQADQATDAAQKDLLNQQAAEIVEIIKVMKGAEYACSYCFAEYGPGDKFCPNCGRGVEVYGVCEKCGEVLGPNVKFCPNCGATAPAPKVRQPVMPSQMPVPAPQAKQ